MPATFEEFFLTKEKKYHSTDKAQKSNEPVVLDPELQ